MQPDPPDGEQPGRDLAAGLAAIWEKYRPSIEEQVRTIENAAVACLEGALSPEARREAERAAHKLAGAAGTFGFARASELARDAEHLLVSSSELGGPEVLRLSEIAVSLAEEIAGAASLGPPKATPSAASVTSTGRTIVIIEPDDDLRRRLSLEAESRGEEVSSAGSLTEGRALASSPGVAVVIIDPAVPEGIEAGLAFVSEPSSWNPPVPVVVLSEAEGLATRVEAARRNAGLYLQKPVSPKRAMDAIFRAIEPRGAQAAKILIVDDAPEILDAVSALLTGKGFKVATLDDPLRFWTVLQEVEPDLLLLDVDMPHVTGLELCRVVRNDERWSNLPIIFLTSHRDSETIAEVFASGADDFVSKPLIETEFLVRITNRLERIRLVRDLVETDQLTGLMNRQRSAQAIEQMIALSMSSGTEVVLALVDVDQLRNINAAAGFAEGDRMLKQLGSLIQGQLGGEDVAGRWAGEEFVVAMHDASRDEALRMLDSVLNALRSSADLMAEVDVSPSFSAGVAVAPSDGRDLSALQRAAAGALAEAKRRGGAAIVPVGWSELGEASSLVDVVIVEDDDALAELLGHAIENRGLSTVRFADGESAARALLSRGVQGRVALLDVDLPGLDGLSILSQIATAGITAATKVIMLTARSAEAEVLRAMELGATDHVAKPFSIPVLLQRLSRALGE